jgi:glycosyltransferase involved in cell wall biosynthesis
VRITTNVDETAPTGGVQMNVFQISRELARRGHAVEVLYVDGGPLEDEYRSFCTLTRIRAERFDLDILRHPRQQARKTSVIARAVSSRPDVIYSQRTGTLGWSLPTKRLTRRPIVCHVHGFVPYRPRQYALLSRHVDRFIMVSDFMAGQWIDAGLDPGKIRVIYNGVDPAEYPLGGAAERARARRVLGLGEDLFVVSYIGRIDEEKGIETLLDAWRILGLGSGDAHLVIVGSPCYSTFDERVAELRARAASNVTFLPVQSDVVTPLHAADVSVVPSIFDEPFGRTVIEGLATGRPVLGARSGAIPEILTGALAELLFDRGDAEALARLLGGLVGWQATRPELGATCHAHAVENFTLARVVDQLEDTFAAMT